MPSRAPWRELALVLPQYLLPQHFLSRCIYRLARCRQGWLKNLLIGRYIAVYNVDMSEAESPLPAAYGSFNEFFTRALRADARPLAGGKETVVSPADAEVSQAGVIRDGEIFQAKGHAYSVQALLGGDAAAAEAFHRGRFVTLYLSPRDYHRVHMPVDGALQSIDYVPGRLFSVNAVTTDHVPGLFARNERIICRFATPAGEMALCMVGALFVGSMETVSHGQITPASVRTPARLPCPAGAARDFGRGREFGRFNMGSTVILLFQENAVEWVSHLAPGAKLKMGEAIATLRTPAPSP